MTHTFRLSEAMQILERTPAILRASLAGLGPEWTDYRDDPDTWTAAEIVLHFINGERTDWIPRARHIREHGTSRPFEPFDRTAGFERAGHEPIETLLDEFAALRKDGLKELRSWKLSTADLSARGQHPALGEATLSQLLATWVAHDLTHVAQIHRNLARRYRDAVGPWRAYFNTLA